MPAYRFYDPAPVFFDTLGVEKVENGTLTFYDIGTTNERDTWSDADLTVLNPNPVSLDSDGRASVNIFLDGDYTVKIEAVTTENEPIATSTYFSGRATGVENKGGVAYVIVGGQSVPATSITNATQPTTTA